MKKAIFGFVAGALVLLAVVMGVFFGTKSETVTEYAMNTVITISVKSRNPHEDIRAAINEVKRIENLMSITKEGSDVFKINKAKPGEAVEISPEVYKLAELSLLVSEKTDGAFDISVNPLMELWDIGSPSPRVPRKEEVELALGKVDYKKIKLNPQDQTLTLTGEGMSINLGSVAKGYAADRCAQLLRERGVKEAIIDLGGNVYILGRNKKVGIQTPFENRGEYFTVCNVTDKSVVTSGAYERYFEKDGNIYHHIMDTSTGYPASSGIVSATVISENSALADCLSTAVYVSGVQKAEEIAAAFENTEIIVLTDENKTIKFGKQNPSGQ